MDNHDGKNPDVEKHARKIVAKLDELGFDNAYLLERSQSATGFHIWLLHSEALSAALVRRFWKQILQDCGVRCEIYPKQDSVKDTAKGYGNLLRYPYWNQSAFGFFDADGFVPWEDRDITCVSSVSERELENCIQWFGEEVDTVVSENGLPLVVENLIRSKPDSLLARRWAGDRAGLADKSLSAVALSLVHELVRHYISPIDICLVLDHWAKVNGYNKASRDDWQRITIQKAYDVVAGRAGKSFASKEGGTLATLTKNYVDAVFRGEDPVISTGLLKLDESIGGFCGGELVVISARPSHGKSALAIEFLDHLSSIGHAGLFVSLEMTQHMTSNRLLARIASDIPKSEWDSEAVQQTLHMRLEEYFSNRAPIYFESDCAQIGKMEEVIRTYATEKDVRVVCVDYQGLASGAANDEYRDQTQIVGTLKRLAKEYNLIMLDLVQMNRSIEKDKGRTPMLSDLRSTGAIEQDADVILVPRYLCMDDETQPKDKYEIHVLKNRNRGIANRRVEVRFDPSQQRFT